MIPPFFLILIAYILILGFFIYVLICGNNKFHRNGCIGKIFNFFMVKIPDSCNRCALKLLPKRFQAQNHKDPACLGKGGPCRFFICGFYMTIYLGFTIIYLHWVHPVVPYIYPTHPTIHSVLSFLVLPWPWIIFIAFQFMDPGQITPTNVLSYLKKYPYDNAIYIPGKICSTLHIPVVPRSRYCRYTQKRVACYDHYCPWVLAAIGERTHRFFLLFLLSDVIASSYYAVGSFKYCGLVIHQVGKRINWSSKLLENIMFVILILFRACPFVVANFLILTIIAGALMLFLCQQIYFVSINKTQVELDKYEALAYHRKKMGNTEPIKNFYNHGIIENWKEFLFPTRVEEHEPVYFKTDEDYREYLKKNHNIQFDTPKNEGDENDTRQFVQGPGALNLSKSKLKPFKTD